MHVFKQYSDTQTRLPLEKYYDLKVKNFSLHFPIKNYDYKNFIE